MARTSTFYKGGLTGAVKIAHLAEAHGMRAQVHGMGLANAQLCAAIRNNDYYEQLVISSEQIAGLGSLGPLSIEGGVLTVSDSPGLGFDFDWERIEATAVARA
jgi:L-alanine-DL-glutamate epimerase-like enolase superfamily enzyme